MQKPKRCFDAAHTKDDLNRIWVLRKGPNPLSPVEATGLLIDKLNKTTSNAEFTAAMQKMGESRAAARGVVGPLIRR